MTDTTALLDLFATKWTAQAVGVVARLRIPDLLADGPLSPAELAVKCDADPDALYRIMRATATFGVLAEDATGRFALTPRAEALRSDVPGSLRAAAVMCTMDPMWRPYGQLEHSVRTGEPAFDHVYGMSFYEYLRDHPADVELFQQTAVSFYRSSIPPILAAYDFTPYHRIVDLGGGVGHLLAAVLAQAPQARGVLFEAPPVIAAARAVLDTDRIELVAGDFFAAVPAGGDLYLIKSCLHNWADDRSVRLLTNVARVLSPQARLLVLDAVVPPGNEPHYAKVSDVELLALAGGRERRADEWQSLFDAAGLESTRTIPTDSPITLMELRRSGER